MLWKRIIGTASGLALAATGLMALAAPAQAGPPPASVSDCDGLTFTVEPNADHRVWRALVDGKVVWTSGDFGKDLDVDLGNDHEKLVKKGWTEQGPFDVHVKARDAKHGPVTLQWWHVNPPKHPNGWTDWAGGQWTWEKPDHCVVKPEKPGVTPPTCKHTKGVISIPDVDHVRYRIDGEKVDAGDYKVKPGKYRVTAKPEFPYEFPDGKRDHWKVRIEEADCPDKPTKPGKGGHDKPGKHDKDDDQDQLPVTGTSLGIASGAAVGLVALGTAIFYVARNRKFRFTT